MIIDESWHKLLGQPKQLKQIIYQSKQHCYGNPSGGFADPWSLKHPPKSENKDHPLTRLMLEMKCIWECKFEVSDFVMAWGLVFHTFCTNRGVTHAAALRFPWDQWSWGMAMSSRRTWGRFSKSNSDGCPEIGQSVTVTSASLQLNVCDSR